MEWLHRLQHPIIGASMAGAAGGRLAAAISRAGGLGTIGFGSAVTPDEVRAQAAATQGQPFGIGLMSWAIGERPEVIDAAVEVSPVLISLSFGDPAPYVERARAGGATIVTQVGTLEEARRALEAGVDLLVARGSEGGGHGRGEVATLPLLQQVLDLTDRPVAAAGGIGTARGVAAVLAAGACAAWVGTVFAGCAESAMADSAKQAIARADAADTVYTRAFDVAQRLAWPAEYGGRALTNDFTEEWSDRVGELEGSVDRGLTERMAAARAAGDVSMAPVYAGQSAGLLEAPLPAAEIMARLAGYPALLRAAAQRWS